MPQTLKQFSRALGILALAPEFFSAFSLGTALSEPFDRISWFGDEAKVIEVVDPKANAVGAEFRVDRNSDENAKEEKTRERLRNGELGIDFYLLRDKLKQLGVIYTDDAGE